MGANQLSAAAFAVDVLVVVFVECFMAFVFCCSPAKGQRAPPLHVLRVGVKELSEERWKCQ